MCASQAAGECLALLCLISDCVTVFSNVFKQITGAFLITSQILDLTGGGPCSWPGLPRSLRPQCLGELGQADRHRHRQQTQIMVKDKKPAPVKAVEPAPAAEKTDKKKAEKGGKGGKDKAKEAPKEAKKEGKSKKK